MKLTQADHWFRQALKFWSFTAFIVVIGAGYALLTDDRVAGIEAATGHSYPLCVPMLEDFCLGQPVSKVAGKQRTLVYM